MATIQIRTEAAELLAITAVYYADTDATVDWNDVDIPGYIGAFRRHVEQRTLHALTNTIAGPVLWGHTEMTVNADAATAAKWDAHRAALQVAFDAALADARKPAVIAELIEDATI